MCHGIVNAKGAKLVNGESSTTTDYWAPAYGRVKTVPYVIHEQAVSGKKVAERATFRYQEKRYMIFELM